MRLIQQCVTLLLPKTDIIPPLKPAVRMEMYRTLNTVGRGALSYNNICDERDKETVKQPTKKYMIEIKCEI